MPERQILNLAGKGVIEAEKPAKKAGSRRGYSYSNLLEFGLCRVLFDVFGFQFYSVKSILRDLRQKKIIEEWATAWGREEEWEKGEFTVGQLPVGILLLMFLKDGSIEKYIIHEDPELIAKEFIKPFFARTSFLYQGFCGVNLMDIKREIDRMI